MTLRASILTAVPRQPPDRSAEVGSADVYDASFIRDPVRDVSRRNVLRGGLDVPTLVVEENVGAEGAQELTFVQAAEEERLVDADVPRAQRPDHPLVGGCAARGDEGS